jgi:hypothetical protein
MVEAFEFFQSLLYAGKVYSGDEGEEKSEWEGT